MKRLRKAFTFLEAIVVIVVFGILAAIGSEIYVKIYENYLVSRVMNTLQTRTEVVIEGIAKRLEYRIKSSTIARKPPPNLSQFINTSDPLMDSNYTILEWIGYDNDGLRGTYDTTLNRYMPGWSGFIDVNGATKTLLPTPGSNLTAEDNLIKALTNNALTIQDAGIVFVGQYHPYTTFGWWPGTDTSSVYNIRDFNATTFALTETAPSDFYVYEQYKLVYSAYAIAPDPLTCTDDCNLSLYTNYQPWQGESFDRNGTKYLLAEHVKTFKFRQDGDTLRIKLCLMDRIGDRNISICKEKVIF